MARTVARTVARTGQERFSQKQAKTQQAQEDTAVFFRPRVQRIFVKPLPFSRRRLEKSDNFMVLAQVLGSINQTVGHEIETVESFGQLWCLSQHKLFPTRLPDSGSSGNFHQRFAESFACIGLSFSTAAQFLQVSAA